MNKIYKLNVDDSLIEYVNDRIKAMNNGKVVVAYGHDFKNCEDSVVVCLEFEKNNHSPDILSMVKKEWLEEIKQPMTAEESYMEHDLPMSGKEVMEAYILGFNAGEENERLKHDPKKTFEEFVSNHWFRRLSPEETEREYCRRLWEAFEKNRGYDEQT